MSKSLDELKQETKEQMERLDKIIEGPNRFTDIEDSIRELQLDIISIEERLSELESHGHGGVYTGGIAA